MITSSTCHGLELAELPPAATACLRALRPTWRPSAPWNHPKMRGFHGALSLLCIIKKPKWTKEVIHFNINMIISLHWIYISIINIWKSSKQSDPFQNPLYLKTFSSSFISALSVIIKRWKMEHDYRWLSKVIRDVPLIFHCLWLQELPSKLSFFHRISWWFNMFNEIEWWSDEI